MARDGSPDDPNNYSDSDPTQYANYGSTGGEAYSEYQQSGYGPPTGYGQAPPPEPTPWHRKPAALVGLGVLTAIVLALLVYAVVKFTGNSGSSPAGTSTTSSTSSSAEATSSESVAPGPGGTTQTVTESPSTTAEAPDHDHRGADHDDHHRGSVDQHEHIDEHQHVGVHLGQHRDRNGDDDAAVACRHCRRCSRDRAAVSSPADRVGHAGSPVTFTCIGPTLGKRSVAPVRVLGHQRLGAAHRGPAGPGGERVVERMLGTAAPALRRGERRPRSVVGRVGCQTRAGWPRRCRTRR